MIGEVLTALELMYRELLLFGGFWLLIGAIDDLCIDVIWLVRRIYRHFVYYRSQAPLRAHELSAARRSGLLAVFIPTWREANVIGAMLEQCERNWRDTDCDHRIYVGCYANDDEGIAEVSEAAASNPRVRLVLVSHPGPTTKADCLNSLWQTLIADELAGGYKAKAIILHDAEDAVHPDELRVFDRLIEKSSAVQLPVIPIRTERSPWISAHYCDEFAEAHGKFMVVREAIGAALPLAGVGCAIDRNLLGRIAFDNQGRPFDESSLTEDYELGFRIGAIGGRTIMARILDSQGELVGTKAHFPETLAASVRQKSRWLTGIALAGWDRLGWEGSVAEKWMLLHDRRSVFSALVLVVAYACIILTALLTASAALGVHQLTPLSPLLITLLTANAGFLIWRMAMRAAFVWAIYGPGQAALSVPRSLIANIIAIMAARRACFAYLRHCFGKPLIWDKTTHHVVPVAK
ncbi:MAG: glycosyl transferase family protein [Sphingorhabdus sp.]